MADFGERVFTSHTKQSATNCFTAVHFLHEGSGKLIFQFLAQTFYVRTFISKKQTSCPSEVLFGSWLVALSIRIYFSASIPDPNRAEEIIHLALFAVSSFTLSSSALLVWHLSTGMIKMVDGFLGVLVNRDLPSMSKDL